MLAGQSFQSSLLVAVDVVGNLVSDSPVEFTGSSSAVFQFELLVLIVTLLHGLSELAADNFHDGRVGLKHIARGIARVI